MENKRANWMNLQASDYVGAGLAGLGAGLGARGIRHLLDLRKKRDLPPEVAPMPSNKTPLQVEVSPEEATQLEQQGVNVKHAEATFLDNVARGALVVPAAYAGWSMLDTHLANKRKAIAQKRLDDARARLHGLMSDQPLPADQGLHSAMKMAEAHYFGEKTANIFGDAASSVAQGAANSSPVSWLGWPLGISGALLGLSAYNRVQNENKYRKSVGALRDYAERQPARPSEAELVPVVHDRKEEPAQPMQVGVSDQVKAAALDTPDTNAPKPKRMRTPVLQTNKDKLVKKLDEIPLAPSKTDTDK